MSFDFEISCEFFVQLTLTMKQVEHQLRQLNRGTPELGQPIAYNFDEQKHYLSLSINDSGRGGYDDAYADIVGLVKKWMQPTGAVALWTRIEEGSLDGEISYIGAPYAVWLALQERRRSEIEDIEAMYAERVAVLLGGGKTWPKGNVIVESEPW